MDRDDPSKPAGFLLRPKRSQVVSLALLATAGAAAYGISRLGTVEEVMFYADGAACLIDGILSERDCRQDSAAAKRTYPIDAPRYADRQACESRHGPDHCVGGETVAASAAGQAVPRMAGYVTARPNNRIVDRLRPAPVYDKAPDDQKAGLYRTGKQARVVSVSELRPSFAELQNGTVLRPRFGGFGGSGHGYSFHGGS